MATRSRKSRLSQRRRDLAPPKPGRLLSSEEQIIQDMTKSLNMAGYQNGRQWARAMRWEGYTPCQLRKEIQTGEIEQKYELVRTRRDQSIEVSKQEIEDLKARGVPLSKWPIPVDLTDEEADRFRRGDKSIRKYVVSEAKGASGQRHGVARAISWKQNVELGKVSFDPTRRDMKSFFQKQYQEGKKILGYKAKKKAPISDYSNGAALVDVLYYNKQDREFSRPEYKKLTQEKAKAIAKTLASQYPTVDGIKIIASTSSKTTRDPSSKWQVSYPTSYALGHFRDFPSKKSAMLEAETSSRQNTGPVSVFQNGKTIATFWSGKLIQPKTSRDVTPRYRDEWQRAQRPFRVCSVGTEIQSLVLAKKDFSKRDACQWVETHDFRVIKIDETENNYRFRQREPREFEEGSFRTITLRPGVKAIIGCPL